MPEEIPHYNVVFCTPGSSFVPGYMNSILMTIYALEREGLTWYFLNEQSSHVAIAREATAAGRDNWLNGMVTKPRNGEFTYDKMMWIDSDIQWSPQDFGKLYYSELDVVSGCYLMSDRKTPIFTSILSDMMSEQDLLNHDEPFECAAIGFGFVCIKSGVFENMERPWFSFAGTEHEYGIKVILGEDVSWCVKAAKAGFKIHVDPSVRVTHNKTGKVAW
jgi:hypothetical protein